MSYDLSKPLVIGISSRALFNLEQENKIFEEQGVEAYEAYQVAHENENLQKGAAFGAHIFFDPQPHILYRQHSHNAIGQGYSRFKEWKRRWKSKNLEQL